MHLRTAATSSAIGVGFVRKVAPSNDGGKSSIVYPDNTTNGLPDACSFRAIGSDVSLPRLTLRTATSQPGFATNLSAFATDLAGPTISKPASASCRLMPSAITKSSSTTSSRMPMTLPRQRLATAALMRLPQRKSGAGWLAGGWGRMGSKPPVAAVTMAVSGSLLEPVGH